MNESALVIGVDRTGGLPPLSGAASGARDFEKWAINQGMTVHLLTDENNKVKLSDIQDKIEEILEPRNCHKLIVYFSGHGFLLSPQTELWLLSDAPSRSQEAVNVRLSLEQARFSGVEHVILISDACRSAGPTHQHRSVTGGSIFPTPSTYEYDGKVDTFYATRPGDVALEYMSDNDAVSNYKGIFTECLLDALDGKYPELITKYSDNGNTCWLVLSENLELHLENIVPIEASNHSIKLNQKPMIIPESRLPQYFGQIENPPAPIQSNKNKLKPVKRRHETQRLYESVGQRLGFITKDYKQSMKAGSTEDEKVLLDQMARIAFHSSGRGHFETGTGFTVYGDVVRASTIPNECTTEIFKEDGASQIRVGVADNVVSSSILIEFEQGHGIILAVFPGYIGTVSTDKIEVVNVNYTPSSGELYNEMYGPNKYDIRLLRAFSATAMRNGLYNLSDEENINVANYLRMMKKPDPTLGIYASYAYQQAGKIESIRSVARHMINMDVVPFDVLLLARLDEPWPPFAPFCPMLRQGWALLELHTPSLKRLSKYRSELLPSLWTTFTPEGVSLLREKFENIKEQ